MRRDHLFTQRNKATKRAAAGMEVGEIGQNLKWRGGGDCWQYKGSLKNRGAGKGGGV